MIDIQIIPTSNTPLTFEMLKARLKEYEGNILPRNFTNDFYMVSLPSNERWDGLASINTTDGLMYSFYVQGHFALLWSFFSNAGDGELLLQVDDLEYLDGYAYNRQDNLTAEILPKWQQIGFYFMIHSNAGRAIGDLEFMYALCLILLRHYEGYAIIDGISLFSLPNGLLTYNEFAQAKLS